MVKKLKKKERGKSATCQQRPSPSPTLPRPHAEEAEADCPAFNSGYPGDSINAMHALAGLFARAGVKAEDLSAFRFKPGVDPDWKRSVENREADPLVAMLGIERVFSLIRERLLQLASECPSSEAGQWAGRILGDFLSAVGKKEKWLAARSPSFSSRVKELRSLSDLVHKQSPSPVTRWTLSAYERMIYVKGVFDDFGAVGLAKSDARNWYGFSELESSFPEKIDRALELPEAGRNEALFSEIVWPWICEQRAEFESEPWAQEFVKTHGGSNQWGPSFANLRRDFLRAWGTVSSRPEGCLRGIERAPL